MKCGAKYEVSIVLIMFISGIIGVCVALPFVLYYHEKILSNLIWSFLSGMAIGFTATYVFSIFIRNARKNPTGSFVLVGLTIGIGTVLAALLLSLEDMRQLGMMVLLAETVGLIMTYGTYRYATRLNDRLLRTQERFRNDD